MWDVGVWMTEAETVNTFEKQLIKVLCPAFLLGAEEEEERERVEGMSGFGREEWVNLTKVN